METSEPTLMEDPVQTVTARSLSPGKQQCAAAWRRSESAISWESESCLCSQEPPQWSLSSSYHTFPSSHIQHSATAQCRETFLFPSAAYERKREKRVRNKVNSRLTKSFSFLFWGWWCGRHKWEDINKKIWQYRKAQGSGELTEGTTLFWFHPQCLSTSWIMWLLWAAVRDSVFKFILSSTCAHNSLK